MVGAIAPLVVGVFSIPVIIAGIGETRFGFLSVGWSLVGYFGILEFGLSSAMAYASSKRIASETTSQSLSDVLAAGIPILLLLGVVACLSMVMTSTQLIDHVLRIPPELRSEAIASLELLAMALPATILANGMRGVLEAQGQFKRANVLKVITGLITYAGPLISLHFSKSLVAVMLPLVIGRWVIAGATALLCWDVMPKDRNAWRPNPSILRELLSFGGWISIGNMLHPLLMSVDRILIAAFISTQAVAYYSTPFEVISKLWIIPAAVSTVLFPAYVFARQTGSDMSRSFSVAGRTIVATTFVPVLATILFAEPLLSVWISKDFAQKATAISRWLALGVFLNSSAHLSYVAIQSAGRPSIVSMLIAIETIIFVPLLALAAKSGSLERVGQVMCLRYILNTVVLAIIANHLMPALNRAIRAVMVEWGILMLVLAGAWYVSSVSLNIIYFVTVTGLIGIRYASLIPAQTFFANVRR